MNSLEDHWVDTSALPEAKKKDPVIFQMLPFKFNSAYSILTCCLHHEHIEQCIFAPMRFELPLVEQKIKPHQVTALHLIIAFSLCGMGAFSFLLGIYSKFWSTTFFQSGTLPTLLLLIVGLGLLSVTFFKNRWLQKPDINRSVRLFELVVTATIAVFAALNEGWAPAGIFAMLTGAVIFAINWEKNTTKTLLIHVDKEGIKLPVISRKRSINWPDVNAVLLRYGTLTIDCADNSLYQWNISQINFDNQSFEEFCLQKIEEGKERRDKNDW